MGKKEQVPALPRARGTEPETPVLAGARGVGRKKKAPSRGRRTTIIGSARKRLMVSLILYLGVERPLHTPVSVCVMILSKV